MICAYKAWGDRETVERGGVDELVKLYVRFHREAERDESLNDRARAWFKKIEDGDAEATALFNWFKEITLAEVQQVFALMDIHSRQLCRRELLQRQDGPRRGRAAPEGLLKLDQGAQIVDLSAYKMPPCIILRSDGATLYATRDIAAALYRKDTYDFARCLYVVAYQQDLHFRQWFKVVELMGYPWAHDLIHVAFGMVSGTEGAFSTRKGNMVKLRDVLQAAIEKTGAIMAEKSPDLPDRDAVARDVGVGALVWNSLYNGRIKDVRVRLGHRAQFRRRDRPLRAVHPRPRLLRAPPRAARGRRRLRRPHRRREPRACSPRSPRSRAPSPRPWTRTSRTSSPAPSWPSARRSNRFYYERRIMADEPTCATRASP